MSEQYIHETKTLSVLLRRKFPFIIDISNCSFNSNNKSALYLDVYVSPEHFCELMDARVEKQVVNKITILSDKLIRSIFSDWNQKTSLIFRFFPEINESTILKDLKNIEGQI